MLTPTCWACETELAVRWDAAKDVWPTDSFVFVELDGGGKLCLGCAASNYAMLCCGTCRQVVAALIGGEP